MFEYLTHARIGADNLDPYYANKIQKLNLLIRISYSAGFKYVANLYLNALESKDWTCGVGLSVYTINPEKGAIPAATSDELLEHLPYLASVANDAW